MTLSVGAQLVYLEGAVLNPTPWVVGFAPKWEVVESILFPGSCVYSSFFFLCICMHNLYAYFLYCSNIVNRYRIIVRG